MAAARENSNFPLAQNAQNFGVFGPLRFVTWLHKNLGHGSRNASAPGRDVRGPRAGFELDAAGEAAACPLIYRIPVILVLIFTFFPRAAEPMPRKSGTEVSGAFSSARFTVPPELKYSL